MAARGHPRRSRRRGQSVPRVPAHRRRRQHPPQRGQIPPMPPP